MTQNLFASLILGLAILGWGYLMSTQTSTISTAPAIKSLQTTAEGKVKITPDTLIISAWVELRNQKTQATAYTEMNTSINTVKEILKNAGIEDKNIQTANLSVSPDYSYADGRQTQEWYQANTTLTIRVEKKDAKVSNDILDAIAKVTNIRMNGVQYDLADKEVVYAEARKLAIEKARQKADAMAKVAWVSVISIQSISESIGGGVIPMYQNVRSLDMATESKSTSSDISIGQLEYTATVNISYEIR